MLNSRLRELRTARGISQVELADALGVKKQSVSNWENDNIQPSIEMPVKLSHYFSVSTDYLLGLERERRLDATGLTDAQIAHLQFIIDDIRHKK